MPIRKGTPEEDAAVLESWKNKVIIPHFPQKPPAKPEVKDEQ